MIKWRAFLKRSAENASEKQSRSGLLTSDINRAMFNEISTIRQDHHPYGSVKKSDLNLKN